MTDRIVAHFSCGAASAVAAKLTLAEHGHERVAIVNAFIVEEHADNRRFLTDCEEWFNHKVTVLADEQYGASAMAVWRKKRYIKGPHGAPCSLALKREVLNAWSEPTDSWVIGYTAEEQDRADNLVDLYPHRKMQFVLIDKGLSKADCLAMVERAGLKLPEPYLQGFNNSNCLRCPKGGANYWKEIRHFYPQNFSEMVQLQTDIGPGAYFLQHRSGPQKGERMPLWELPEGRGDMRQENFSCSFFCQMAEEDMEHVA